MIHCPENNGSPPTGIMKWNMFFKCFFARHYIQCPKKETSPKWSKSKTFWYQCITIAKKICPTSIGKNYFACFGAESFFFLSTVCDLAGLFDNNHCVSLILHVILRFGGTSADETVFSEQPTRQIKLSKPPKLSSLKKSDIDNLVKLVRKVDFKLIIDLNLQLRYGNQWDPTNAATLLAVSRLINEHIHIKNLWILFGFLDIVDLIGPPEISEWWTSAKNL